MIRSSRRRYRVTPATSSVTARWILHGFVVPYDSSWIGIYLLISKVSEAKTCVVHPLSKSAFQQLQTTMVHLRSAVSCPESRSAKPLTCLMYAPSSWIRTSWRTAVARGLAEILSLEDLQIHPWQRWSYHDAQQPPQTSQRSKAATIRMNLCHTCVAVCADRVQPRAGLPSPTGLP